MLLEFRVSNFRSIRDELVFSMVAASGDKTFADTHLAPTGLKGLPNVVRSAVVYGANASGKSTLLMAMQYMRMVVAESATAMQPNQNYNLQPFKLDTAKLGTPTSFVLSFLMQGVRYEYAFAMRPERFVSESLTVYRTARPTLLFSRQLAVDGQSYDYEFSSLLPGPKKLWQDSTRPNALFLSTAAQLNSELLGQVLRDILDNTFFIPAGVDIAHDFTTALLKTSDGRNTVGKFLAAADISIADVQTVSRKGIRNQIMFGAEGQTQTNRVEGEFFFPVFEHKTLQGSAMFELHEESQGTQRLFGLIAPLTEVLKKGQTLVVDELDSSLHTLLVRQLVSLFHSTETNPLGAQLIFTTHDTALLDTGLFRRDQIWLTEKDDHQATRLYPLTDFSPRKGEAIERGYLAGRYGGIPFLPQRGASH
jgi:uncharacterized protein